jgi:hypothetical protein
MIYIKENIKSLSIFYIYTKEDSTFNPTSFSVNQNSDENFTFQSKMNSTNNSSLNDFNLDDVPF